MGEVRNGDQKVRKYLFPEIFYGRQEVHKYFCTSVVVVVVFTLTDWASTIPSNIRGCQSGTWSQRGIKVNGSHHGDNPLLRPTGIQIATILMVGSRDTLFLVCFT